MKPKENFRKWIFLVLLLIISVTFLFLQLLSFKAIDSTFIARLRVLDSVQRFLPFRSQKNEVLKHLRAFGEVSRKCGVPIFLFHPLVSSFSTQNSNELQEVKSDPCQLCHHRTIVFGVKDAEWQEKQTESLATLVSQFRFELHSRGFHSTCHTVKKPWFDSSEDFFNIKPIISSCSISKEYVVVELLIFYDRKSYLWHGPLQGDSMRKLAKFSEAFSRLSVKNEVIDGVNVRVPAEPHKLLFEQNQSHFIGCNLTNAQRFYSKYGRDVSPDALLFKKKALQVLSIVVEVLDHLGVRFWLSSGTCLGWFRQCDIIPHSKDVDIGIWIKDYNPLLVSEFKKNGLPLKHRFGQVDDSFELSFKNEDYFVKLDIFFFYEEKDSMWNGGTQAKTGRKFKYIFPKFTLCWTEFLKLKVRIPCETETYVRANYGDDWHAPIKEWNWKESPPNVQENGRWDEKEWDEVIQLF